VASPIGVIPPYSKNDRFIGSRGFATLAVIYHATLILISQASICAHLSVTVVVATGHLATRKETIKNSMSIFLLVLETREGVASELLAKPAA
jgi:hypothetical protein